MVGVAGRSKACNTCRQRRIACSQERPQCAQCIKSNRVCTGYQRERVFLLNQAKLYNGSSIKNKVSTQSYNETPDGQSFDGSKDVASSSLKKSKQLADYLSFNLTITKPVNPSSTVRQQILNEFLQVYLPDMDSAVQHRRALEAGNWLVFLADMPSPSKALEISMLAVSMATLGRMHEIPEFVNESMRVYGQGLAELQRALWDPKLMYKDDTLAACMALSMYEIIECPARNGVGWLTHSGGCARLMQLRGPKAHQSQLGHLIFRSCRFSTLLQALPQHRNTFLASPEWLTIPWDGRPKPLFDKMLDVFAKGLLFIEQGDALSSLPPLEFITTGIEIYKHCNDLDSELSSIYAELEATSPGPIYWPEFARDHNLADDEDPKLGKVFSVKFQFINLQTASACVTYWTLCLLLWRGMADLHNGLEEIFAHIASASQTPSGSATPTGTSSAPSVAASDKLPFGLPPLGHRADYITPARNICQSVEYCLAPDTCTIGPTTVAFPLQVVIGNLKTMPQYRREVMWAAHALEKVTSRGLRILKFVEP